MRASSSVSSRDVVSTGDVEDVVPQPLALKPDKTFAFSHVYAATGTFVVTVRVDDDDSGSGSRTF